MNPQVRTGLTHVGSALGGGIAVISLMSSHKVDLYAIWDQLNVVVADVTKLVALATPLVTAAYGIYKTTATQRLNDLAKDPNIKGVIAAPAVANAVPSDKVVASAADLPPAAKA